MSYLGVVTAVTPDLMVRGDLSITDDPAVNMSSVTLVVADRVDVDQVGKQLHVLGTERMAVPTGMGGFWFTDTAPAGFVILTGANLSRTGYAGLFALWGTSFGVGDGATTFGTPNPLGKSPVGKDGTTEFAALGQTGGAKTHTLTTAEMPSHNHLQNAHGHSVTDPEHNHPQNVTVADSGGYGDRIDYTSTGASTAYAQGINTGDNNTGVTVDSTTAVNQTTGDGTAHSILNPSFVVNFIVRT